MKDCFKNASSYTPTFIYLPIGCSVIEENSGIMKPCQIPFIFKNETFYGCTTILGKSETGVYRFGNPWCSTKTTVKHEHISNGGFYGDCLEENCPSAGEADDFLDSLFDTGKSLSEALLFAEHGGEHVVYKNYSECQKQFLYTTCSPQV